MTILIYATLCIGGGGALTLIDPSKTPCMTTETLSLMGNSLGHPSLDVRVDVRRLQ